MGNIKPTEEALVLNKTLIEIGLETKLEHWDGHKHVDIYIPSKKLYIEIDGVCHYTDVSQIISDFQRDHYSDVEGFKTLRIPSEVVKEEYKAIAQAIKNIV